MKGTYSPWKPYHSWQQNENVLRNTAKTCSGTFEGWTASTKCNESSVIDFSAPPPPNKKNHAPMQTRSFIEQILWNSNLRWKASDLRNRTTHFYEHLRNLFTIRNIFLLFEQIVLHSKKYIMGRAPDELDAPNEPNLVSSTAAWDSLPHSLVRTNDFT